MKKLILLPLLFFFGIITAQELDGAWKLTEKDGKAVNDREVIKIIQDGYFALGSKNLSNNEFLGAAGGELSLEDETLTELRDFDTYDTEEIGAEHDYNISWDGEDKMEISDGNTTKIWERVSEKSDALTGTWVITGRERNGEMNTMTPGDRRTVKILSGGRFQWIAFNSATKEFNGTGGGTYTAENGKYTENIEFFSRDASRVGASLEFQYEVKDGKWHHKGKSSKGDPIYEIWSPYSEAYQK
ncbi:hypothetical protein APR41_00110 [Salegentibacter salinarum]|uniref:Membrane or secreted protein n=1 Tax=Salegentibacter salinarum TaxID=447422 RepID=A0A2N0U357_9FLAO|nr:hypothetical protein [Salegentibacter salinarum]PKD21429.1 hypothetical protein APR41_00110 [Salegentibacter salinarum]SKB38813.1 hypothetical protein SAMN05660903_00546 [Salegentibacter salinarum]